MSLFDNATSITINNKEVSSIKIGTATLYEKGEPLNANELIITINGSEFSTCTYSVYDYDGLIFDPNLGANILQSVDWGDGTTENYEGGDLSHTYATSGTYTITITCNSSDEMDINEGFFESDNITSITFPNVHPIEFYCIKSENLSSITFTDTTPPRIVRNSEDDWVISDSCTIYVPQGSLNYQRATNFLKNVTYVEY